MGALQAERVVAALRQRSVPSRRPVALVEGASTAGERVVRGVLEELPELAAQLGDGPAVMIVGDVVAQAQASDLAAWVA